MEKGYPWGKWFNGRIWRLIHGEDFDIDPERFRVLCLRTAHRRHLDVRTSVKGSAVIIRRH